ncbi:MAG: hypothetical protein M0C28_04675 [Candidatus Moduliflexus flocculans]|nr:hypothetical protein [Candidatus Moduliflexus flocculans]
MTLFAPPADARSTTSRSGPSSLGAHGPASRGPGRALPDGGRGRGPREIS